MENKWAHVRERVKAKKEKWAQQPTYYRRIAKWGDIEDYGFTLQEPYTREEVEEAETLSGIELPTDLKEYLIFVSRELFEESYPIVFSLEGLNRLNEERPFNIPAPEDWSCEACDCDIDAECDHLFSDGTLDIGNGGCTDSYMIVLRGHQRGTIWVITEGGGAIMKTHETFAEYIKV